MINRNSEMAKKFWENGKLPCPIIDFHAHMDEHPNIYFPAPSADEMLRSMDRYGIRWLFFCGHMALDEPLDGEKYNRINVQKHPDRMRAYHIIMPRYLDCNQVIRDLEIYKDIYVGCKILGDYSNFPINDPSIDPVYRYLNDNKLFLLIHTWGHSPNNDIENVADLARRYPNMTLICGHSFFDRQIEACRVFRDLNNVCFEITALPIVRGYFEDIVHGIGSERILFGTDLPWFSTMHGVGMVLDAEITDEDRRNIFYRNGDRLLSRFDWYRPTGEQKFADTTD